MGKFELKLPVNMTAEMASDLEKAKKDTGFDQSEIVRACISMALPALLKRPSMILLLSHDSLKTSL